MSEEKKDGLFKKVGKTALKTGSESAKGAIMGTVTAAAAGVVKDGIKQATEASGLSEKTDGKKGGLGLDGQLKKKENEMKKKLIKEGIKRSLK